LVALILVAMCACVSTVAFFGWSFRDQITEALRNPEAILNPGPSVPAPQNETAVGEAVELRPLFAPMWEVRDILYEQFYEQPVNDPAFGRGAAEGLAAALEAQGVDLDSIEAAADAPSAAELAQQAGTPDEVAADFAPFWEEWRKLQFGSVEVDASYEELMRSALHAAVAALGDPHTNYMDPVELNQANLELEGNYEGIGAWVDTTGEYVVIIAPMEGSPAAAAGLMAGDQVLAIDGVDMAGLDGDLVVSKILGPAGSTVVLTIGREGEEPFDVSIVRASIFVPSVESQVLDGGIGYIQLFTFGSDSSDEMHRALQSVLEQNPSGLIIDLRNNGGGYLDTAVNITSEFLSDGVVLYEDYSDGTRHTYDVESGGLATEIPLVVLVNPGTASASEILAGAIQDYGRGVLVGETTFGKGSVQISRVLSNNQGALRVTIAHWLTPEERLIHNVGLEPDYVVALTQDDVQAGRDPQLDKAIELLSAN
jgi:carboxyl-terminal processing protease